MSVIKLNCIDQALAYENTPIIASGDENVDYVEFDFCNLWDGYGKIAVFYQQKSQLYWSVVDGDNRAVIPAEVMGASGTIHLGVIGVSSTDSSLVRTSEMMTYRIEGGALDGFTVENPSDDLWQQVLSTVAAIQESEAEFETDNTVSIDPVTKHWLIGGVDTGIVAEGRVTGVTWGMITGNIADQTDLGDVATEDIVPILKGGTGETTAGEALEALGGISMELLWTNASPTSVFYSQTISLDLSGYQMFAIKFRSQPTQNTYAMAFGLIDGQATNVMFSVGESQYGQVVIRNFSATPTGVSFSNGAFKQLLDTETYQNSPQFAIPIKIYGIKGVQ